MYNQLLFTSQTFIMLCVHFKVHIHNNYAFPPHSQKTVGLETLHEKNS
jgi:hypothetical protein